MLDPIRDESGLSSASTIAWPSAWSTVSSTACAHACPTAWSTACPTASPPLTENPYSTLDVGGRLGTLDRLECEQYQRGKQKWGWPLLVQTLHDTTLISRVRRMEGARLVARDRLRPTASSRSSENLYGTLGINGK